ncbi:MAG: PAS domain-containing protein [Chloroflexi bacterium]|jgi:PAS domain S-box-containing protein|nr:PAS domain-containing protein [Chloroflexota bacterium]
MGNAMWVSRLLYFVGITISLLVLWLTWKYRGTRGRLAWWGLVLVDNLFVIAYMLEIISPDMSKKLFWGNLRFIVTAFGPLAWLYSSFLFSQRQTRYPRVLWPILLLWPTIFILLVYTDPFHRLIYPPGSLKFISSNLLLDYSLPLITQLLIAYSFIIAAIAIFIFVARFFSVRKIFRWQIATLLFGILFPYVGILLSLLPNMIPNDLDLTFYTIVIGNLILAWGLYRYQLFDIIPIAREVLIENIHDGVLVLDEQQRVVDINPIALAYINLDDMDVIGSDVSMILPVEKRELQNLDNNGSLIEIQLANGDEKRALEIKGVQLEDKSGNITGRLLVLYDITEKKHAQQKLEAANKQLIGLNARLQKANTELEKLSKIKDEFIANISHELRSPLNNIRLNHDLLSMRPESSEKYLDVLKRETERLTVLIEDLLMVSRVEQQQVQPKKSPFDLNQLLTEYFTDRQALARDRGLSMSLVLDETIPFATADRAMVSYMISALLTNAINFTPAGGTITVASHQRSKTENTCVGISITDTGIGILPEEQTKIFMRFVRGAAIPYNIPGTGLGLAVVKELVELHRGEIQLTSTGIPGEGSKFQIWLPVCDK